VRREKVGVIGLTPGNLVGKPRVDDRRVLSGIIFINRNGLRWRDAPAGNMVRTRPCITAGSDGATRASSRGSWRVWPPSTARPEDGHDRRDVSEGTPDRDQPGREKGGRGRLIGRTKGGMNTKLHAICDSQGVRSPLCHRWTGQRLHRRGALLRELAKGRMAARRSRLRRGLVQRCVERQGIRACIPGRKQRKTSVKYDKRRYKRRNRIEIMFGRLKDWRRVATRYDRCPKVFLSAIALAATVIFWL
jgi:transposase